MERKRYSEHVEALRGRSVVILANNDDAGKQYAKKAAEQLCPLSHGISITEKLWLLSTLLKTPGRPLHIQPRCHSFTFRCIA
ncbi:MAG: hypothetical protein IJL00_07650 [Clostridia bacterium]|nr:hypothetical protein [Clostridia bacterium]